MSGYHGHSKSNNAISAEAENRFPASVLAHKLKVQTGAVKALMVATEWPHMSKHYNEVFFYDGDLVLMVATDGYIADYYTDDELEEAIELLDRLREWRPPQKDTN